MWFRSPETHAPYKLDFACGSFRAGFVGLSLSYALPITGLLNGLLTSTAETEQEMVAVERMLEFSRIPPQVCSNAK